VMKLSLIGDRSTFGVISPLLLPPPPPGAFVICWTPGLVVLLLDGLGCERCKVLRYEKYFLVLAECNSFVNPIIYSFRDKDMWRTFKRIVCYLCRRGQDSGGESAARFTTLEQEVPSNSTGSQQPDDNGHCRLADR